MGTLWNHSVVGGRGLRCDFGLQVRTLSWPGGSLATRIKQGGQSGDSGPACWELNSSSCRENLRMHPRGAVESPSADVGGARQVAGKRSAMERLRTLWETFRRCYMLLMVWLSNLINHKGSNVCVQSGKSPVGGTSSVQFAQCPVSVSALVVVTRSEFSLPQRLSWSLETQIHPSVRHSVPVEPLLCASYSGYGKHSRESKISALTKIAV